MRQTNPERLRDTVFVIGAGFSGGLGYPLTKSLLIDVWNRLEPNPQGQLREIISFHHPIFDVSRNTTFPDIEQVLTEIAVNLDLFDASRPAEGTFKRRDLEAAREELLFSVSGWFHEIYRDASRTPWLDQVVGLIQKENAALISFNWDLVLDQRIFENGLSDKSYGLSEKLDDGPVLLKPHGSLNWYDGTQMGQVSGEKRVQIFSHLEDSERVEAFLHPRAIESSVGRRYTPLIIPPTYLKDFRRPVFRRLWQRCTDLLSTPRRVVFLGYSLPPADLHAQFILRCGFNNQEKGRLRDDGKREAKTGAAEVIVVNPDQEAARRIEAVVSPSSQFTWVPKRIQEWVESGASDLVAKR